MTPPKILDAILSLGQLFIGPGAVADTVADTATLISRVIELNRAVRAALAPDDVTTAAALDAQLIELETRVGEHAAQTQAALKSRCISHSPM